jgi:hypothetical protein
MLDTCSEDRFLYAKDVTHAQNVFLIDFMLRIK